MDLCSNYSWFQISIKHEWWSGALVLQQTNSKNTPLCDTASVSPIDSIYLLILICGNEGEVAWAFPSMHWGKRVGGRLTLEQQLWIVSLAWAKEYLQMFSNEQVKDPENNLRLGWWTVWWWSGEEVGGGVITYGKMDLLRSITETTQVQECQKALIPQWLCWLYYHYVRDAALTQWICATLLCCCSQQHITAVRYITAVQYVYLLCSWVDLRHPRPLNEYYFCTKTKSESNVS